MDIVRLNVFPEYQENVTTEKQRTDTSHKKIKYLESRERNLVELEYDDCNSCPHDLLIGEDFIRFG